MEALKEKAEGVEWVRQWRSTGASRKRNRENDEVKEGGVVTATEKMLKAIDQAATLEFENREKDDPGYRTRQVQQNEELGRITAGLHELFLEYAAQCMICSQPVHPGIKSALLDTATSAEKDNNLERARSLDLSGTSPPLVDQDLRILCIALMRVSSEIVRELHSIRLCDNLITANEAARAVVLLMCVGNGALELDLSRNSKIVDFDQALLQLKKDLKNMSTSSAKRRIGLRGLILDGCGIKRISAESIDVLYGIEALSLSYTNVSNLWSTVTALQKLQLRSLAFQEPTRTVAGGPPAGLLPAARSEVPPSKLSPNGCRPRLYSPICREKAYRAFMLHHLRSLEMLDRTPVLDAERAAAKEKLQRHYEIADPLEEKSHSHRLLKNRELGWSARRSRSSALSPGTPAEFARACASSLERRTGEPKVSIPCDSKTRPRQFEYNPTIPGLMVYGSIDGHVYLLDHERGRIRGQTQMLSPHRPYTETVLGLCWTTRHPNLFLAGSDSGSIQMFNASKMEAGSRNASMQSYSEFLRLTSLHINCTDEQFIVSGYAHGVVLYDLETAKRVEAIDNCHSDHVNVVKFSNHSPNLFLTSSFDGTVKLWDIREPSYGGIKRSIYTRRSINPNVMACFSPDDRYVLASAVDNEVKQYNTFDGSLVRNMDIRRIYSPENYTRSYFLNDGEYFVTGSCCENVVRIFNTNTGQLLREIEVESRWFSESAGDGCCAGDSRQDDMVVVQSLRGDPFVPFNFSILAASQSFTSTSIVKVDLLGSTRPDF